MEDIGVETASYPPIQTSLYFLINQTLILLVEQCAYLQQQQKLLLAAFLINGVILANEIK